MVYDKTEIKKNKIKKQEDFHLLAQTNKPKYMKTSYLFLKLFIKYFITSFKFRV